ncbi:MAG TPA: transposase family protein [Pyrinomonadaceae bacterium]|nr:transposase family protein [Pyrinomonadaceae bacterium]
MGGRGHGDKLSRKADAAIVALLAHPTMPQAAKAAGVSESTLWRWLQRDDFRRKYREAQDNVFSEALGLLKGASTEAVNCLRRNLTCGLVSAEVQAAKTILDYTLRTRDMFDLQSLLDAIERAKEETQRTNA